MRPANERWRYTEWSLQYGQSTPESSQHMPYSMLVSPRHGASFRNSSHRKGACTFHQLCYYSFAQGSYIRAYLQDNIFSPNCSHMTLQICLWGWGMECYSLIYILHVSLQCYMQYHFITDHTVGHLQCNYKSQCLFMINKIKEITSNATFSYMFWFKEKPMLIHDLWHW